MKKIVTTLGIACCSLGVLLAQEVKLNQVGFYKQSQKLAVVPETSETSFSVVDVVSGNNVYSGNLSEAQSWSLSGETNIRVADFSALQNEGIYYVKAGNKKSEAFNIGNKKVFEGVATWSIKAFYLWRASTAIEKQYATFNGIDFSRKAGHLDNVVLIHSSAASKTRPTGTVLSSSKGWYDAGDYNKYVVNAGPAVFSLLHAYELFPEYYKKLNLNIPESNNTVPDILDEVKWETDWLLTMQDPEDGGVYFKLTDPSFCGMVMPANAPQSPRYLVAKSTAATLDFAAMMAKAARNFAAYETEFPGYAVQCLNAAKKALNWGLLNPTVSFSNPSGISTGGYGDSGFADEIYWARIELFLTTNDATYLKDLPSISNFDAPSWPDVQSCGLLSIMQYIDTLKIDPTLKTSFAQSFYWLADRLANNASSSAYRVPINSFFWGSNGYEASMGMVLGSAYKYSAKQKYLDATVSSLDYLLGRNATLFSFVSGFGDKYPANFHDRRTQADGIAAAMPGYVAGGPNAANQSSDCGKSAYPSTYGAKSYLDQECSYSTNEIAINWNGPLAFLAGAVEAAYSNPTAQASKIATSIDGAVISISYAESLVNPEAGKLSYAVVANGTSRLVDTVRRNPLNDAEIQIVLHDSIKAGDTMVYVSTVTDSAFTVSGLQLDALDSAVVLNNVYGADPVIISATSSADGKSIVAQLNKGLKTSDTLNTSCKVYINGVNAFKYAVVDTADSTRLIMVCSQIFKYDNIGISYSGYNLVSVEGGVLRTTTLQIAENVAPEKPAQLSTAVAAEDGYTLTLSFDKTIRIVDAKPAVLVSFKNGSEQSVAVSSLVVTDNKLTVTLATRFTFEDTILITSVAKGLCSQTVDSVMPFVRFAVTNTLPRIEQYIVIDTASVVRIEAENYIYNNGLVKENCSDTGGGISLGYTDAGDWTDYLVDVKHAGTYRIKARIASASKASEMQIMRLSGTSTEVLASLATTKTGGWQTWASVSELVQLEAGKQTIRMFAKGDLFNINWLQLSYGTADPTAIGSSELTVNRVYPNPCNGSCFVELDHSGEVTISSLLGEIVTNISVVAGVPTQITLKPGVYIIRSDKYQSQVVIY